MLQCLITLTARELHFPSRLNLTLNFSQWIMLCLGLQGQEDPPCLKVYLGTGACMWKPSLCQFTLKWTADGDFETSVSYRLSPWILFLGSLAILWSFHSLLFNSIEERQDRMTAGSLSCTHEGSCGYGNAQPPACRMRTKLGCWVLLCCLKNCCLSPSNLLRASSFPLEPHNSILEQIFLSVQRFLNFN